MKKIFIKYALLGSFLLFLFYYVLLYLVTRDPVHPFVQFKLFQPWMSILILGFGVQIGLFFLIRNGFKFNFENNEDKMASSAGGAMSGVSMVACCAHHISDVVPILGVSGASLFLTEYQKEFLILGVVFNAIAIIYMLWLMSGKMNLRNLAEYTFSQKEVV